jgi:hypothetical protein
MPLKILNIICIKNASKFSPCLLTFSYYFFPKISKCRPIWDRCYDFLNIFAEKFSKKWRFLLKLLLVLAKIVIITLVFEKNANFFRRKLGKIAENCDHNIDPWSHWQADELSGQPTFFKPHENKTKRSR